MRIIKGRVVKKEYLPYSMREGSPMILTLQTEIDVIVGDFGPNEEFRDKLRKVKEGDEVAIECSEVFRAQKLL